MFEPDVKRLNVGIEQLSTNKLNLVNQLNVLSDFAKKLNINIKPFDNLAQIENVTESITDEIYNFIKDYLDILLNSNIDNEPPCRVEKIIFEKALKNLNLKTLDNMDCFLNENDIIEIYDIQGFQKYRNLIFLKFCSFDLFTLYSKSFIDLYERSTEFNGQILNAIEDVINNPKGTIKFNCGEHLIKEKYLNNKKIFKIKPKWISPLIGHSNKVEAVVLTNFCEEYRIKSI